VDALVDALPVVNDIGRMVGIVSWSDIVAMVARRDLLADRRTKVSGRAASGLR
jgi:acetoin utilization protein AcuB